MQTLRSFTVADLRAAPEGITASHQEHTFKFTEGSDNWTNYSMEAPCGHVYSDNSLSYLKSCARTWAEAYAEDEALRAKVADNSPNGCFERHGYTVVRTPKLRGPGNTRTVLNPQGEPVLNSAGYDAEIEFCRANGLMAPESVEEAAQVVSTYKRGSEFKVGDMIHVGIGKHRTGRIVSFKEHPQFAELNPGWTARVAVTDRGSITVIDQQPTLVPQNA